ncbi:MAG: ABC transporter ATP-binding protein [Christensenellales bacterium]|jgi:ATP-binding cassette subfamily B multidrug efflux pump
MKKLTPYIKGWNLFFTLLAPLLMLVEVFMDLLQPTYMANIIDVGIPAGLEAGSVAPILAIGLKMLAVALIGALGGAGCSIFAAIASGNFAAALRQGAFAKIQTFSFREIDTFRTSSLVTRLTNDVTQVQNAYQMILKMAIRAPFSCIGGIIMAVTISPRLSVIFLVSMPIIIAIAILVLSKASPMFGRMQQKIDRVNTVMRENLLGVRVVKAFVSQDAESARFDIANKDLKNWSSKAMKIVFTAFPVLIFIVNVSTVAVLWFGAQMVGQGMLMTGEIMAFINYLTQILMSIMMVAMIFNHAARAKASADRLAEILTTDSSIQDPSDPVYTDAYGVEFRDVTFSYSDSAPEPVLKHISFTAEPGQTIGIIGGTGSGKTSLVSLIPRLYDATEGEVLIGGVNVKNQTMEELRKKVGMVMQESLLFYGTVEENLRWGDINASAETIESAAADAQADEFLSKLPEGMDTIVEQRGKNFSGGQKQRLSLARTFIKQPDILILDDSTSAVDLSTEARIQAALKKKTDMITFIIAQRISAIADADKILVMDEGRITDQGTHAELLKRSEIYRSIAVSQLGEEVLHHAG